MKLLTKLLLLIFLVTATSFIFFIFTKFNFSILERRAPIISVKDLPRGISNIPVSTNFSITDAGTGLSEVVVRVYQKNKSIELLREKLKGQKELVLDLSLESGKLNLQEGSAELEIRAFDKSFWSNTVEERYSLVVDFYKPTLDSITTQHNVYKGGTGLIAYKTKDENLVLSGVKANGDLFSGFPARSFDRNIRSDDIYLSLYVVDPLIKSSKDIFLFSEDMVGNSKTLPFYNKVLSKRFNKYKVKLKDSYIEKLKSFVKHDKNKLSNTNLTIQDFSIEDYFSNLMKLEELDRYDIKSIGKKEKHEKLWNKSFLPPVGVVMAGFNDTLSYSNSDKKIGSRVLKGYEFKTNKNQKIYSLNDGIVVYSGNLGYYGNVVMVDHGIGLVSIFAYLGKLSVNVGDRVDKGTFIATSGESGMAREHGYYLEFIVSGHSTNPRAWWDESWYNSHIEKKIKDVRRELGLPMF